MPLVGHMETPENRLFGALAVRYSPDATLLLTVDGTILMANAAATALFGYSSEELASGGQGLLMDSHDPQAARLQARCLEHGSAHGEIWCQRRDGGRFPGELTGAAFEIEGAKRMVLIVRDISERRHLQYQQRLVHAAMADSPSVICVIDEDWTILWANRATEHISGYPRDVLIGRTAPVRRYLEQEDPKTLLSIRRALTTSGRWTGEVYTRRRSGEAYPLFGTFSRLEELEPGERHYVATLTDVSTIREHTRKLRDMAYFDRTTGLANRTRFRQLAIRMLQHNTRDKRVSVLLMIDVDRFHEINQTHGFAVGDQVLQAAAQRLSDLCSEEGLVACSAGDTFVLLDTTDEAGRGPQVVAEHIRQEISRPLTIDRKHFRLTASIGISLCPTDSESIDQLVRNVQIAMQGVKDAGGDGYAFYEHGFEGRCQQTVETSARLEQAIDNDELVAYFQPVVDSATMDVVSMEALVRWVTRDQRIIQPEAFVPAAEQTGLITRLTDTVIRQACRHLKRLDATAHAGLECAVNLSARQFRDPDLAEHLLSVIAEEGMNPARLCMEITESLFMDNPAAAGAILKELQRHGVKIIIDDFGTGFSSLGYLKSFDVNGIKLDRLFLREVPGEPRDEALVSTILSLGHGLEIPVVAEGVESHLQARFLRNKKCTRLQGYYISPPLPADEFIAFLEYEHRYGDKVVNLQKPGS